jgi:hypothetical protein
MPSNPMSIPELSNEARDAVKAAFDALSTWRIEVTNNNEKNCKRVIEKMAAAAAALGWPEQIVETSRAQMRSLTEMQIKAIDRIMDSWDEQLKSPIAASPSATLSSTKLSSSSRAASLSPNGDITQMAMAPFQFWMSLAEQWQKPWAEAMGSWAKVGKSFDNGGLRGHGT